MEQTIIASTEFSILWAYRPPHTRPRPRTPTHHTHTALDRNDNSPIFEDASYNFRVAENTDVLDRNVFVVLATDDDDGTNSEITYSITGGNQDNVFVIGKSWTKYLRRLLFLCS